ncbi:MAG: F0F1 ATP synthase subunit delta [Puniceicoccales bacterium]|jgi:F-type H+-transporting ATPase subunit delta|nr:F0F1 ATP synthase subunit delta [Puniceicoccales bacterium]
MPTSITKQARLFAALSLDATGAPSVERVQAILETLETTRSPALLRSLYRAFHDALRREIIRGEVHIEHAGSLEPGTEKHIAALFTKRLGRPVTASTTETPALIAGMRIRVGDDIYDASLRNILDRLESETVR